MRLAMLFLFTAFSAVLALKPGIYAADWAPLWTAGRLTLTAPLSVYDFDLVTRLQSEPFREVTERPFVYPPSALLLFAPLSLIPFWASFAIFSAASLAWFTWLSNRAGADALLILAAPPVVLAAVAGQPTLLVAAMVVLAFATRSQTLAGVLFGLAAMVKPTLLLLAPVALIAGRQWGALGWACATAALTGLASAIVFGFEPWVLWLESLPQFQQLIAGRADFVRMAVTPYAFAVKHGFDGWWIPLAMAAITVPIVWHARNADALVKSGITMGGALLISPYAMVYELAALAPAVLAGRSKFDHLVSIIWAMSLVFAVGMIGLITAHLRLTWVVFRQRQAAQS